MRNWVVAAAVAAVCALDVSGPSPASADILVNISKTSQRMSVLVDGSARFNWPVSTGAARYTTPSGVYKPQWVARMWRSKQYGNAPMPHSVFFHNGYAVHGTNEISRLGKIASHGCVRLHPDNAAKFYSLVQNRLANTRIVVSNDVIEAPGEAPKKKPSLHVAEKAPANEPAAVAAVAPEVERVTVGAAPAETAVLESEPVIEKTPVPREASKTPAPVRNEKVARAGNGFRW
jgi:hypothetical protein